MYTFKSEAKDLASQYDAFSQAVRDRTAAIHRAVWCFPPESWVTPERLQLAQKIANRLQEVINEFRLEVPK